MNKQRFQVYVARNSLSDGCIKTETVCQSLNSQLCYVDNSDEEGSLDYGDYLSTYYILGQDAFLTEEEAIAAANEMRRLKIDKLESDIAKLKRLDFRASCAD